MGIEPHHVILVQLFQCVQGNCLVPQNRHCSASVLSQGACQIFIAIQNEVLICGGLRAKNYNVLGLINTPGRSGPWKDRLKRADIRLGKDCPTDDVFLLGCPYCRHAEVRPAGHTSIRCLLNYANPVNPFQVVFDLLLCRSLAIQVGNTVDQVHHLLPFCLRNGLERLLRKLFPTDYLLQPHKNRRGLRPVGGVLGLEGAVLIPGQDARLAHELHPRLGPVRHGIPIREGSRRVPGLGQGEAGAVYIAGDHGSHLLPGHRAIGGKIAVSCAIHNSFPSGPGHIGTIPPACRHIGKPTLATLLLRAGHPAQDGDKHSPGQTAAGLEHCGAHPIHQVIFIDIAHRLVGPMALGNIGKGVLSRRQGRARQQGQHHAQRQGCGNHSSLHKPLSSLERYNDV